MKKIVIFFLLALPIAISSQAGTVFVDKPGFSRGWSVSKVTKTGDGWVHGPFGKKEVLSRTVQLTGFQTKVTVRFRYWLIDSWDSPMTHYPMDYGCLKLDGKLVWKAHCNNPFQGQVAVDIGSGQAGTFNGNFPNPWFGDHANHKRYVDVSLTYQTSKQSLKLVFYSTLDQDAQDESYAVNRIVVSDNSTPNSELFQLQRKVAQLQQKVRYYEEILQKQQEGLQNLETEPRSNLSWPERIEKLEAALEIFRQSYIPYKNAKMKK